MPKSTITRAEYVQLVGLLDLAELQIGAVVLPQQIPFRRLIGVGEEDLDAGLNGDAGVGDAL